MSRLEVSLPVEISATVAPLYHDIHLLPCPHIEVNRLDAADVCTHAAVYTRAADAEKAAEVPRRPAGVIVLAVCAELVIRLLHQPTRPNTVCLFCNSGVASSVIC